MPGMQETDPKGVGKDKEVTWLKTTEIHCGLYFAQHSILHHLTS